MYGENASKIMGVGEEVTLPTMEAITQTLSGAGILGEVESPTPGHFQSMELEVPFVVMDEENASSLLNMNKFAKITLRGSMQYIDGKTGEKKYKPVRVVARGWNKSFEPGKLKIGEGMDTKIKLEVVYYLIEVNGKQVIELDKLNTVFKLNGKDMLKEIRKQC